MTRWTDAPIVGGAYSDDTRPWSVQDTVNLIPVYAEKEGTRSPKMLRCAPGYSDFADLGTNAPIRGMRDVEGLLLAVSGNSLFSVNPKGQVKNLGTIPGVGRVILSHNQITGGNEVAITPGYIYNTVKGTLERITDEGFPGAKSFDYIDSYFTFVEPGGRFAGISDLADGMSYNTNDRFEAEGSPDKIVGQIVSHEELWMFGERTAEPFRNTGATNGTFQRAEGMFMEVGAASPYAIVNLDNSFFWLGGDGVVYRANGYTPVRISTHPIEQAISRCTTNTAFAFTFEDRGHKIFYLTFQDGHTWGYDVATQEWHRRESKGLNRWRVNDLVKWNGKWVAGDFSNGKLYTLDWDVQSEAGVEMERMRVTGVLSDGQNAAIVNALEIVFDTGQPQKESAAPPLTITGNAPDGYLSEEYSFAGYVASGGIPPYTFSLAAGSLAPGLTGLVASTGAISGTPTEMGVFAFTPKVTDSKGSIATTPDSIAVRLQSMDTAVMADDPLLYWPINETSGSSIADLSGNAYTGTATGGFTLSGEGIDLVAAEAGIILNVGSEEGSPIDVGSLDEWAIEQVITIQSTIGSVGAAGMVQWRSPNLGHYNAGFFIDLVEGAYFIRGGFSENMGAGAVADPSPLATNARAHYLCTKREGTIYLYRNGVEVASVISPTIAPHSDGAAFVVGAPNSGYFPNSYGWIGRVQYVAVYEHALTADRAIAHATAAGTA